MTMNTTTHIAASLPEPATGVNHCDDEVTRRSPQEETHPDTITTPPRTTTTTTTTPAESATTSIITNHHSLSPTPPPTRKRRFFRRHTNNNVHSTSKQRQQQRNAGQCGCHPICSYPNNAWTIIPTQLLVLAAFGLTINSVLISCNFLRILDAQYTIIDAFSIQYRHNNVTPPDYMNATIRTLGILGWEDIDGRCAYTVSPSFARVYWNELLQCDQHIARKIGIVTLVFGMIAMLWVVFGLSCIAHTSMYRIVLVMLLSIVMPICQSFLFTIVDTDICQENECEIGEAGTLNAISIVLYFIAGLILLNPDAKIQRKYLRNTKSQRSHPNSSSDNPNNDHDNDNNKCMEHSNGIADAVEIAVDREWIDHTLISYDHHHHHHHPSDPNTGNYNNNDTTAAATTTRPAAAVSSLSSPTTANVVVPIVTTISSSSSSSENHNGTNPSGSNDVVPLSKVL